MIAVDTNILVRYFVEDQAEQSAIARRFLEHELTRERPGFVALVALVELAWVLKRSYRVTSPAIREILARLLLAEQIVVEHAKAVEAALGAEHDDVADMLIHEIGRMNGCASTVTFDRPFARTEGVELLSA